MDFLVIFGTTAASIGCGLLLMWLACTVFFSFLMRTERSERAVGKHAETSVAPLRHSTGGPQ